MTIEIHELDITDGLNRELYNQMVAKCNELSNKVLQLEKKLDIAINALQFFINPCSLTAFKGSDAILKEFRTGAKKVLKQLKEAK